MRLLLTVLVFGSLIFAEECVCPPAQPQEDQGIELPDYIEQSGQQFFDDDLDDTPWHTPDNPDGVYG